MKHFVNFALLLFFPTLVVSGVLRFWKPFELVTTRVHIVFGFGLLLLVLLHLLTRGGYYVRMMRKGNSGGGSVASRCALLGGVVVVWALSLGAALWNWWPVEKFIGIGYEASHRKEIFRSDPLAVYESVDNGARMKRATPGSAALRLEIEWGPEFPGKRRGGQPFDGAAPQIAIWAEAESGSMIETLFVSERAAFAESFEWAGIEQERADVLPVWRKRYDLLRGGDSDADVISGATPEHSFSLEDHLRNDSKAYYLYVEVNAPNDANEFFNAEQTKKHEGYTRPGIGQPSVLYEAYIQPGDGRRYYFLELTSHSGSSESKEGDLSYDMSGLTTAKKIIEKIVARVDWPEAKEG